MKRHSSQSLCWLVLAVVGMIFLYLTYQTYGNWQFALSIRGKKIVAFILVGIGTSFATITFQTLTENHFLTPSILGFDSFYVLLQTLLFFFFRHLLQINPTLLFLGTLIVMVVLSTFLFSFVLQRQRENLYLLLMLGMVLGTFFSSISTFLQVLMDPNEFEQLQGRLFASFNTLDVSSLHLTSLILIVTITYLWRLAAQLDVLHLGREQAINLGVEVDRLQVRVLVAISTLVALVTALVGPITFLGFIVANLTYQWLDNYKHRELFVFSSLLAILLLLVGQFLVEKVFKMNATLNVIIEFIGGIYFIGKLFRERKWTL